ncbi:MAG: SPOR domain-containing protein [Hyphomicrobiaceae bacterium]|nr:SPOR domain-containing protein [Hyphomicrobiaceae bacterium]MCC0009864.1 SPOR domain-containing protein [Hyphomicrobiaceae bacterium]
MAGKQNTGQGLDTMTHAKRQLANGPAVAPATIFAILISGFLPLAAIAAPTDTTTAAPTRSAPMGKGEQALKRGIAAYQKNAFALAVGACSSALSSGGLSTQDTAKALYYRGLSYRRQGRAALAISDLTNALWLKDGLDGKERADALVNRAAAYKAAGIADPGAPQAREASAPASPAGSSDDGITTAALTSSEPAASAPTPSSRPANSTASQTPPAQSAQTPAAPGQSSNPLGGIGSFFGNLFSGGSSQQAANAPSTDAPDPANEVTTASTGSSAVSSWSSSTQVQSGQFAPSQRNQNSRPQPQRTAALASPNTSSKHKGKYKLQVGAVRSRAEAERLAKRFASEHGNQIDGRALDVQEAVFGNMGTFYRVNVGPYASAKEPDKLCKAMRGSGYDCLVVTH